jgi:hypothetical protein
MIKTFTPNSVNFANNSPAKDNTYVDQQNSIFYEGIKPKLKALVKNPSEDTIAKILAYAKLK